MAQKAKRLEFTTPSVPFRYPAVSEPHYGSDDYPKKDGEYKVSVVLPKDSPEARKLISDLAPVHAKALEAAREEFAGLKKPQRDKLGDITVQPFYRDVYEKDNETPTGEVEFKFTRKYSGTYSKGPKKGQKWTFKLPVMDSKCRLIPSSVPVWSGSTGRISFSVNEAGYFIPATGLAGISLSLEGVQVIDLVSKGQRSAKALGFDVEEDGLDISEYDLPEDKAPDAADDSTDDDADDDSEF